MLGVVNREMVPYFSGLCRSNDREGRRCFDQFTFN